MKGGGGGQISNTVIEPQASDQKQAPGGAQAAARVRYGLALLRDKLELASATRACAFASIGSITVAKIAQCLNLAVWCGG